MRVGGLVITPSFSICPRNLCLLEKRFVLVHLVGDIFICSGGGPLAFGGIFHLPRWGPLAFTYHFSRTPVGATYSSLTIAPVGATSDTSPLLFGLLHPSGYQHLACTPLWGLMITSPPDCILGPAGLHVASDLVMTASPARV